MHRAHFQPGISAMQRSSCLCRKTAAKCAPAYASHFAQDTRFISIFSTSSTVWTISLSRTAPPVSSAEAPGLVLIASRSVSRVFLHKIHRAPHVIMEGNAARFRRHRFASGSRMASEALPYYALEVSGFLCLFVPMSMYRNRCGVWVTGYLIPPLPAVTGMPGILEDDPEIQLPCPITIGRNRQQVFYGYLCV